MSEWKRRLHLPRALDEGVVDVSKWLAVDLRDVDISYEESH